MSDHDTRDCASIAPYLSAYADAELAEPMRSDVARHLSGCAQCATKLDHIRSVDALIAQLPHTAPSADVFKRTLAAVHSSGAESHSVIRETLHGAGRAPSRRRAQLESDDASAQENARTPRLLAPQRRAPWITAAIPLVAALLLISLAVSLFSRFPSMTRQGASSQPTPSMSGALRQTRVAVNAVASQLSFKPVIPAYLPNGVAGTVEVSVGPSEQVEANSRYLDIRWTFSSGPAQSLHLRELPAGLGFYGYQPARGGSAALMWTLPQMTPWQGLTPTACATCLAVGQTGDGVQLALDAQPRGSASSAALAVWLRLVSLSLDAPYTLPSVTLAAPASSLALRYQAVVSDGQAQWWDWNVTVIGAAGSQQYSRATGKNGADVTEIINSGLAARFDNAAQVYEPLALPLPSALPPRNVTQPLYDAGAFLLTGELWNLGAHAVTLPDGRRLNAYDLYRVNAAQPEHIYADATTGQVIALVVDTKSSAHPGGLQGAQTFVSTTACLPYTVTYTSIEYAPQADLSPTLFDTQQPAGWSQGTVAPAFTCQG